MVTNGLVYLFVFENLIWNGLIVFIFRISSVALCLLHRIFLFVKSFLFHLFADAETLLQLIRYTLPGTEYTELKCPLCSEVWKKEDLVKKCPMSEDEKCFLDCVLKVNLETKKQLTENTWNIKLKHSAKHYWMGVLL